MLRVVCGVMYGHIPFHQVLLCFCLECCQAEGILAKHHRFPIRFRNPHLYASLPGQLFGIHLPPLELTYYLRVSQEQTTALFS